MVAYQDRPLFFPQLSRPTSFVHAAGVFSATDTQVLAAQISESIARVDASYFRRILSSFGWAEMGKARVAEEVKSVSMDKKKLDYFKKRLETRQSELRRTVSRTQQDGRTVDEDSAQDIADRAASSYNKEFLFSQSNNDRQILQMVEGALSRIREGNFGECISCGKEINPKRLEAVPWTRHCIDCQEKLEQGILEETSR